MDTNRTSDAEVAHYNRVAANDSSNRSALLQRLQTFADLHAVWCEPSTRSWLDSTFDCAAQADVYTHLQPKIVGGSVLQIGGSGVVALKSVLGGARHATLVTPSQGEADLAASMAERLGIAGNFEAKVGFGEELPVDANSIDAIISEACLHHTDVADCLRDSHRALVEGGRFGAWDPWRARLYRIGIAVFGKRDPAVDCRPLDQGRINALKAIFPDSEIRLHGAVTRYPALAASKLGMPVSLDLMLRLTTLDDRLSRKVPALRRNGSSVAVLAEKAAR